VLLAERTVIILASTIFEQVLMELPTSLTRHRASTSTRWHFAFRYVAIATQPLHWLQIRPIVHNEGAPPTILPSYIRVRAVLRA